MGNPDVAVPEPTPTRPSPAAPAAAVVSAAPPPSRRRWIIWILAGVGLLLVLFEGVPWLRNALSTVSTDDAFVNGHVTFVAARVSGYVTRVLVDDNNRVNAGDLLVQLD